MTASNDMREPDRNLSEPANSRHAPTQRFHRGPLGAVLTRFISSHAHSKTDYSALALEKLWDEAARHDPAIGLHLFSLFTPQDRHVLALMCQYCATVGDAMRYWARYAALASDMDDVALVDEAEGAVVELSIDAPANLSRYLVEHYFVMALSVCSEGAGQTITPLRVQFAHSRPAYHAQYGQRLGDQLSFDSAGNRLYFSAASLALPMTNRHPGMLALMSEELDRILARQQRLSGWAGKVAQSIRQRLARGEVPSLDSEAERLHQSPRTLRRRLDEQGLTFRQLLDLMRAELEYYLELQGESRAEIASKLGYSDLTAYLHARKRWRSEV